MTIEIADRLIKLRKQKGYSQEELADKLGLSRQAVSKWERAEASPDTDNLICLAKLYGVSLDELLSTDEDIDTIVKEQVKAEKEETKEDSKEESNNGTSEKKTATFEKDGDRIILTDNDGKSIEIGEGKFVAKNADGKVVKVKDFKHDKTKIETFAAIIEPVLFILAGIAYILLGAFCNMWYNGWVVFFIPDIICSIFRAIGRKRFCEFNMAFSATFAFFFVCMVYPGLDAAIWHPMWVVFLAIPLYYAPFGTIDHYIHKEDEFASQHKECVAEVVDCCKEKTTNQ